MRIIRVASFVSISLLLIFFAVNLDFFSNTPPKSKNGNKEVGKINAQIEVMDFEDSIEEADIIVEVEIENKIKELDNPSPKTLYSVVVLQQIKGKISSEKISILQQGNSEWTFNDNNQFQPKERYILFLKKAIGEEFEKQDVYWLLGEETLFFSVVDDQTVVKYANYETTLQSIEIQSPNMDRFKKINQNNEDIQIIDKESLILKIQSQSH